MKKSEIKKMPKYFDYYIDLVDNIELIDAFYKSKKQIDEIDIHLLKCIGLKVYAEGKWSVNKVIQHLTDWERIWCYRTLIAARNEGSIPEGHDQNLMADNSNGDEVAIDQLLAELRSVRLATIGMFSSFDHHILEKSCKFYKYEMSVLAVGFSIIGHQLHHFNVIDEKYSPLCF